MYLSLSDIRVSLACVKEVMGTNPQIKLSEDAERSKDKCTQ
jgi:hypothetical protein